MTLHLNPDYGTFLHTKDKGIEVTGNRFFVLGEGILLPEIIWEPTEQDPHKQTLRRRPKE